MIGQRIEERMIQLERYVEGLQSEMVALKGGLLGGSRSPFRIAEVTSSPIGTTDNVFGIVFLDAKYTKTAGTQSPTYQARQTVSREVVCNLASTVIPIGTRIPVWIWNQHWWTYYGESSSTPPAAAGLPWHIVEIPPTTYGPSGVHNGYCVYDGRLILSATTPSSASSSMCGYTLTSSGSPDIFVVDMRQSSRLGGSYSEAGHNYLRSGLHAAARLYDAVTLGGVSRPVYGIFDHNDYNQVVQFSDVNQYVDDAATITLFPYTTTRAQYGAIMGFSVDTSGIFTAGDSAVHMCTFSANIYSQATGRNIAVSLESSNNGSTWSTLTGWPAYFVSPANAAISGLLAQSWSAVLPAAPYYRVRMANASGATVYMINALVTFERAYRY